MQELLAETAERSNTESMTSRAYLEIRKDIVSGVLTPGSKLKIEALRQRYNIGASPVREALSLLTSTSLVERIDQRGFRAAPISIDDFDQLLWTRCQLESIALRESMARGARQWEEQVLIATYRLSRLPRRLLHASDQANPEWEQMHKAFHMTLLSACGSKYLISTCDELYEHNVRYRLSLIGGAYPERDVTEEHSAILDGILAHDADRAVALLQKHYHDTGELLRRSLGEAKACRLSED